MSFQPWTWFARSPREPESKPKEQDGSASSNSENNAPAIPRHLAARSVEQLEDTEGLVGDMLCQGRYALLMRHQIAKTLSVELLQQAREALNDAMSVIPQGEVHMTHRQDKEHDVDLQEGELEHVEALLLDRYPVTNIDYLEFVSVGGYEQMGLWDRDVWPAVVDFVDQTGHPGPRHWSNGSFPVKLCDHPVVGVNWYEAAAYGRWAGKRLPSDAEWVKAAAWPISVSGAIPIQRRFPWGDSFDPTRANIWNTGFQTTVSVQQFTEGVSPGSVYGLVGNVWEWTSTNYGTWDNRRFEMSTPFKSLRGGAFDTYFESQADNHFQSGDVPIARKHNIGFRCAVGLAELSPRLTVNGEHNELATAEEVHVATTIAS